MPKIRQQASTGERVVFCSRQDCAHSGDPVPSAYVAATGAARVAYFVCEADIVILDRRAKFGKVCAALAKKGEPAGGGGG